MSIFRVGFEENLLGFMHYCIQKKHWYGWTNFLTSQDEEWIKEQGEKLEQAGNIVFYYI